MNNFPGIVMTSGHSQDIADQQKNEYIENILVLLGIFIDDASRLAALYTKHSNRKIVSKIDIGLALKTRAFHGDSFWNRSDIQERIRVMQDILNEENQSENESESEEEMEEEENDNDDTEWIQSSCTCDVCSTLNQIDDHWNNWNPTSRMEISIKNAINKAIL
jgi:hypothetical protein